MRPIDCITAAKEAPESWTSREFLQPEYHPFSFLQDRQQERNTCRYSCVSMRLAVRVNLNKAISMTTLRPDIDRLSESIRQVLRPELTVPSDVTNKKKKRTRKIALPAAGSLLGPKLMKGVCRTVPQLSKPSGSHTKPRTDTSS